MCKTVWHVGSVMNWLKCVTFLAWYGLVLLVILYAPSSVPKCEPCSLLQAFNPEPVLPPISARPDHVEKVLKTRYHDAMTKLQPQGKELDLLIVILPDNNGSLYGMKVEINPYILLFLVLCFLGITIDSGIHKCFFYLYRRFEADLRDRSWPCLSMLSDKACLQNE